MSAAVMTPRAGLRQLASGGHPATPIWGYDGRVPGAEIRVRQGEWVERRLQNALPRPTTVHWHGIRIDNAMDGVPGLTQNPVPPGGHFDYDFIAPDAGTFWYHAHTQSMEQVARGLYGPLIIDEPSPPDADRDLPLLMDDWKLSPETFEIKDDFDNFHDLSHAGRIGNVITVNGQASAHFAVRRHQRLRLRLINAANARIFDIGLSGLGGWVVALDGMPLDMPAPVTGALTIAPAQRVDLLVDVLAGGGETAALLWRGHDGSHPLVRFSVTGGTRVRRPAPGPLPPNSLPEIVDAANAPLHRLVMRGGAMHALPPATLNGTLMQPRELALLGKFWTLNGVVGMAHQPFFDVARGRTLRIAFINDTGFHHAMHLHGHHFRPIAGDGSLGPWRDTVLVRPGHARQVAMVADNPGKWLLHCHMLSHAASGMMTWFNVRA